MPFVCIWVFFFCVTLRLPDHDANFKGYHPDVFNELIHAFTEAVNLKYARTVPVPVSLLLLLFVFVRMVTASTASHAGAPLPDVGAGA